MSPTGRQFSEAASRRDLVQFHAQYRTEHDVPMYRRPSRAWCSSLIMAGRLPRHFHSSLGMMTLVELRPCT
jgi:hypothetical protein